MKKIYYLFVLVILSLGIYVNPVEGRGDLYSSKAIRALEKLIDSQGNLGTSVTWGAGVPGQDIVWTFDGESNDGTFGYYEDEDAFAFTNASVCVGCTVPNVALQVGDGTSNVESTIYGNTTAKLNLIRDNSGSPITATLQVHPSSTGLYTATNLRIDNANLPGLSVGTSSKIVEIGASSSYGQINVNSGDLVLQPTGNTGFGDTSSDYQLEQYDTTNTPTYAMSDDDIAHGLTTLVQTDIFYHRTSISTTVGGTQITSITDADGVAYLLRGVIGATNPTDTTPAVRIIGAISDGSTGIADMGAAETVFALANNDNADGFTMFGNNDITMTGAAIKLTGITGTTEDYLCLDANEKIIRKTTACSGV